MAHDALQLEARFLQHPAGGGVVGEGLGVDADHILPPLGPLPADPLDSLGHNAPAPVLLGQPVAQFGGHAVDIAAQTQGNAAHRVSVHLNGPEQLPGFIRLHAAVHKILSVGQDIGEGERIPQIAGDFVVIGVPEYVSGILPPPLSQNELHFYSSQNSLRGFQPSTKGPSWPITLGVQTATTSMVWP